MSSCIPWFPLEVHLDDRYDLVEAEFGLTGFAVVVKLLQKIYGGHGYYCEWTKDVALLFSKKTGLGGNVVSEIVSASISRGIFDKPMYEKYRILTSREVQERYFEAVSRRKRVEVRGEYLLFRADQKYKNVINLSENADISEENADIYKQRKEEKSIEKYSTEEERKDVSSVVVEYQNNISSVTPMVRESIIDWLDKVSADVIIWAINEASVNNKRSWKYIEGILRNQVSGGRTTMEQIEEYEKRRKLMLDDRSGESGLYNADAYDYDALERAMWEKIRAGEAL